MQMKLILSAFAAFPIILSVQSAYAAPISYLTCNDGNPNGPTRIVLNEDQGTATLRIGQFEPQQYRGVVFMPDEVVLTPSRTGFRWYINRSTLSAKREIYAISGGLYLTKPDSTNIICQVEEQPINRKF